MSEERGKSVVLKDRDCAVCGKKFDVELDEETQEIITDCFYGGDIRMGIGQWSAYELVKKDDDYVFVRKISVWKMLKYKLIDFKRLIKHQYKDVEYWECPTCKVDNDMKIGVGARSLVVENDKVVAKSQEQLLQELVDKGTAVEEKNE